MNPATLAALVGAALVGLGLYGLVVNPHPLRKLLAFNLVGSGAFLVFGMVARRGAAAGAFLAMLDELRVAANRRLFLGLAEAEAHYARYAPGTGYARHRDRFRDSDARVLSLVAYLNDDWGGNDGGALRLHLADGAVDIAPLGATAVCFRSELEHEVLPAARERLSIAAWFRRRV